MDLPNDDDCALFWAYCDIYNGGAYEKMNPEEKAKYNAFTEKREEYPDAGYAPLKLLAEAVIMDDDNKMNEFQMRYDFEKQFK